jgi:hypothetical protein
VIACLLLGACQTTSVVTSDNRPMPPEPRPAPRVPSGARANAIAMTVGARPADSNGNGFPDRVRVDAYLFSQPHPTPLWQDGSWVFELRPPASPEVPEPEPIAEWRFDAETARERRTRLWAGPGHMFQLDLLEVRGTDVMPIVGATVVGRFEPGDGGAAVHSTGAHTIQLGRNLGS